MVLPLLMIPLLLAPSTRAESCESTLKQMKAQLEAAQKENAQLKKQLASAGEEPYLSYEEIVDALGDVTDFALAQGNLKNVDLATVYTAANASYEVLHAASEQATAAASKGLAAATEALYSASHLAQDLHGKHVSQHSREYVDTAAELYTAHLEPHVSTARKAYYENVHPHVGKASEALYAGVGAAAEGGRSLSPKLLELHGLVKNGVSQVTGGKLGFLVEPRTFTVMGRTFRFNHGLLDCALAGLQGLIAFYLGFMILWKLCLSTLVWKLGIQIMGRRVFVGLVGGLVKVCIIVTRTILKIAFTLVLALLSFSFTWFLLALCGMVGIGILHGVEKGLTLGLAPSLRLGAGAGVGFLLWVLFRCTLCKKRKAEAKPTNGKEASPKNASGKKAAASKSDAKQATKPVKGGKK